MDAYEIEIEAKGKIIVAAKDKDRAIEIAREKAEEGTVEFEDIDIDDVECLGEASSYGAAQEF